MKNALSFILIGLLLSCHAIPGRELTVTVDNQSSSPISAVSVYTTQMLNGRNQPTDSARLGAVPPATNRVATLNSQRLKPTDGSFLIKLTDQTGVPRHISFGYFTNGIFLDKGYTVLVKPDTVLVQVN